jgi:5-methylcytosine-specific restriction enzyme subunit McrC
MYQMLAYCTVLGLQRGHLISPGSTEGQRVHQVRQSGVEIVAHTLDLSLPPDALLGQIAALAGEMAAMP